MRYSNLKYKYLNIQEIIHNPSNIFETLNNSTRVGGPGVFIIKLI